MDFCLKSGGVYHSYQDNEWALRHDPFWISSFNEVFNIYRELIVTGVPVEIRQSVDSQSEVLHLEVEGRYLNEEQGEWVKCDVPKLFYSITEAQDVCGSLRSVFPDIFIVRENVGDFYFVVGNSYVANVNGRWMTSWKPSVFHNFKEVFSLYEILKVNYNNVEIRKGNISRYETPTFACPGIIFSGYSDDLAQSMGF